MLPDYLSAATKAAEILIDRRISSAPVDPLPILKSMSGVIVVSFTEMAERIGVDRQHLLGMFRTENHDAATAVYNRDGHLRYVVVYNQRLPFYMLQRAIARELGHIVLGHDGSRPEDVRHDEALCFAQHLLCPRPIIKAVENAGIPLTVEVVGSITGCYERCLAGMRKTPGVRVAPEINRILRDQFAEYVADFVDFQNFLKADDESMLANFGTFMEGYEE